MQLHHGLDFDRTYVDDQISSHELAIEAAKEEIASGANETLRAIAKEAMPVAEQNLDELILLQQKMGL